jgi:hypothetical protein
MGRAPTQLDAELEYFRRIRNFAGPSGRLQTQESIDRIVAAAIVVGGAPPEVAGGARQAPHNTIFVRTLSLSGIRFRQGSRIRSQCAGRPATSSRCKSDTMKE